MADLNTKTFLQLVQGQVAAIQARGAGLLDFAVGSILRAVSEATAGVALWLQALVLAVLAMTRLSTSDGADADSFVADFGGPFVEGGVATFARLGSAGAVGEVTFSRFSTSGSAVVLLGATVETADGSQRFTVALDPEHVDYSAGLGGYVMDPAQGSVTVPVLAITEGAAGNVLAGSVTVVTSPIPGVDTVTNAEAFVGGRDPEGTPAMRVRFRAYIRSLREATPEAIIFHASNVQNGLSLLIVENQERSGVVKRGFVYVIVDDGTGTPPQSLLDAVAASVEAHRAAGVEFAVYAPDVITANVVFSVILAPGLSTADAAAARAAADVAVTAFLNAQPLGADLIYSQLFQVAYNASSDIVSVTGLTLNAGTANIVTALDEVIKAGTVTVT